MSEASAVNPPKAYRVLDRALVAGVAAGLSTHSRLPVWAIRAVFVLGCGWKLSGAVAYAVLWLLIPREEKNVPIGLVAAERQGLRVVQRKTRWQRLFGWIGCFIVGMAIAFLIRLYDTSWVGLNAVYGCTLGLGVALVWLTREVGWPRWGRSLVIFLGVLLAWTSGTILLTDGWKRLSVSLFPMTEPYEATFFFIGAAMAGCVLIILPWLLRPPRSEEAKQAELIAQTRADMAAHLHDSVLQTLAVMQKRAGDAKAVAQLARRQEKELREWLYAEHTDDESATTALKDVIAELEATYPVAVELVTVGDHEMTVEIDAVVRAVREAILNAAKHSGADKIDVYAEISAGHAEAYVRDRGCGFRVEDIEEDRMGIRRSIVDRMMNYGGQVDIRSTPGEGTEIHLSMPLTQEGNGHE